MDPREENERFSAFLILIIAFVYTVHPYLPYFFLLCERSYNFLFDVISKLPCLKEMELGCEHYERNCKFVAPCCRRIYTCRFCHDDKEDHAINRHEVDTLICGKCTTVQSVKHECEHCGIRFGKYTCLKCRLFDNKEKGQFHCEDCGICRIGGEENYFHCHRCSICLPKNTISFHKCVENASRRDCPVCLEDLHTSRDPCHVPSCGHLLHMTCYKQMKQNRIHLCPTCLKLF